MAYDFFPKTTNELQQKTSGHPSNVQGELFLLFEHLRKKYPTLETPINLDLAKRQSVNISRALETDVNIATMKQQIGIKDLSMKFGNGSSGNRGVNNRGNLFEPEFATALENWWNGEPVADRNMLTAIKHIDDTYGISKNWKSLIVDVVGGENTKRPIVYTPQLLISNPKGTGDDVGKSVTDITLRNKEDNKEIYLSLKLGTTVTFFNLGVRTVLTPDNIKAYNIQSADGEKLLKLFGIDERKFCDVFNGRHNGNASPEYVQIDKGNMTKFMRSGIGKGYHIVHKLSGTIKSKEMNEQALATAANITSAKVYYGGKGGTGKRVDIEMESSTYKFKLNIRDTQGKDGYPTRLMCDFTYK